MPGLQQGTAPPNEIMGCPEYIPPTRGHSSFKIELSRTFASFPKHFMLQLIYRAPHLFKFGLICHRYNYAIVLFLTGLETGSFS